MSEQQNTALIESLYAAFARGDVGFILDRVTVDTVWIAEGPAAIPYCGQHHGQDGVLKFFQALGGTLENISLTTEHFAATGDIVMSLGRFSGIVRATGQSFDIPAAHCFQIRDGKVAKFVDVIETASVGVAYTSLSAKA